MKFLCPTFYQGLLSLCLLTITVHTAVGQVYSPLFAPNTSQSVNVYCLDGNGYVVTNCSVTLSTGYYADTNAHTAAYHSGSAPLTSVSPTSLNTGASGYASATITTTNVGHAEYLRVCTSTCTRLEYAVGHTIYWVSDHGI